MQPASKLFSLICCFLIPSIVFYMLFGIMAHQKLILGQHCIFLAWPTIKCIVENINVSSLASKSIIGINAIDDSPGCIVCKGVPAPPPPPFLRHPSLHPACHSFLKYLIPLPFSVPAPFMVFQTVSPNPQKGDFTSSTVTFYQKSFFKNLLNPFTNKLS